MKIYTKTKIYQRFVIKMGNCEEGPESIMRGLLWHF